MTVVGLVVHQRRAAALDIAGEMARWLGEHGHRARVAESDSAELPGLAAWAVPDEDFADGLGLVVSIGGDGTMLRTVAMVSATRTPVLGVNVGHLGYLTVVEPGGWREALVRVFDGGYRVEERMTLGVSLFGSDGPTVIARAALNDAVVEKLEAGHTVRVEVSIGGRPAMAYAADAVIVATPTGSTAYNLSAGGPLVSPDLGALLVTPVAPHSLFGRSLVVGPGEILRVRVLSGSAVLSVDGRHRGRLCDGDVVECRAGTEVARLVTFEDRDFWRILKAKFGLNGE